MKQLYTLRLSNLKILIYLVISNTAVKLNFYKHKIFFLKLFFVLLGLTQTLVTQAQRTFTICQGEQALLSGFRNPPTGGAPGTTSPLCQDIWRNIEPKDGVASGDGNSYVVAPLFTTTYTVTSGLMGGAGVDCQSPFLIDEFMVFVKACESPLECNVNNLFTELSWLNELINYEDENGFGYYDYVKLYYVENESYIEVFAESSNNNSKIYTCDGLLFCERQDSLSCPQFNDNPFAETFYNTTCTSSAEFANSGDNKVDLQAPRGVSTIQLRREELANIRFNFFNNGPCYLYETDFVIEINDSIVGIENWLGAEPPSNDFNRTFNVETDLKYHFKPDTDYTLRVWPVNPNSNSDLNFANDTLTRIYERFESNYNFEIQKFLTPIPPVADVQSTVSIILDNQSNAKQVDEIYIYWSVNGEEQKPLIKVDYAYNLEIYHASDRFALDTIEIGNYLFETNKDYLIEAWVDLPPELRNPNQPQDKLSYFLPANSANIDLAITGLNKPVHQKINEAGEIYLGIVNAGNIKINEFTIKWFVDNVEQSPVEVHNLDWQTRPYNLTLNEKVSILIDTLNVENGQDYDLRFIIETPEEYPDSNLDNNSFTFNYKAEHKKYYQADLYVEVCKEDSVVLSVKEFREFKFESYGGGTGGIPGPCGNCLTTFDNSKWFLNDVEIDTTLCITVKPETNALYRFSTDAYKLCTGCGSSGGSYDQDDLTVGVILIDCEKPASLINNCANNLGQVLDEKDVEGNSNIIADPSYRFTRSSIKYVAYDIEGNALNFTKSYVKFDYELLGPQISFPVNIEDITSSHDRIIYQPITITCLEEIGLTETKQSLSYQVCPGDQIEEAFQLPPGISSNFDDITCLNLQNTSRDGIPIDSYISEDCNFKFEVNEGNPINVEAVTYSSKFQTIDYSTPLELEWDFAFYYQTNCEPVTNAILETYPFLTTFIDLADCAGKSVYVYDADDYEFIIVKTHLAEILLTEEGKIYCMIPTGGFSFIELYDESRIIEQWSCEEGFEEKFSVTEIQNQGIQIFPNPAKDKVFINLQQLTFEHPVIFIYDVQGKQVKQITSADAFAGIVQLNVGDLERGIYLVEVRTSENILTQKLLIN